MNLQQKRKNIVLIMLFTALFGISMGLWENYKIVWLEGTGFNTTNIATILSLSLMIGGILAVLINIKFRKLDPKIVIQVSIILKTISLAILIFLFQKNVSQYVFYILFILDGVFGCLVFNAIYPLITKYQKSDQIYSIFKITDYTSRDVGLGIAVFIIAFICANYIEYNIILIISAVLSLGCLILSFFFSKDNKLIIPEFNLKGLFSKKSIRMYYAYAFVSSVAYDSVMSFQIVILRDFANLQIDRVSIFLLILGIIGDIFGLIALYKLTPKTDYFAILLKFGSRFVCYSIVIFINNPITIIVTMMVVLFFSRAYENVSDGKFVNAVKQENRFAHTNLRYLFSRSGHALGTYISGLLITIGINYVFMMGAIMVFIQIVIICLALWHLKKDIQKDDFKNKRLFIKKYAMVKDVKSVLNKKKYRAKF